jgi:inositol transport system substrate-binding protein
MPGRRIGQRCGRSAAPFRRRTRKISGRFDLGDAVISMNDNMAAGAIEAIEGSGAKTYPFVYGVDGTAKACLLIKDGKMTSTSLQNANLLAVKSMKLAHDMLTGAKADLHQTIDADLITKDNVDKFIELHKTLGNIK